MLNGQGLLWNNLTTFKGLFMTSTKKVFLDAFISNRTIDFVESMTQGVSNRSVVLVNKKIPAKRKAITYTREKVWNAKAFDDIRMGKKNSNIFWVYKKRKGFSAGTN